MRHHFRNWSVTLGLATAMVGASATRIDSAGREMPAALLADGGNWPSGGRDYSEQHYSPLKQIDRSTIGRLGLAWSLDLDGEHSLEATPLAIDGTLYFSGQSSTIYAVDAATGRQLWKYDPEVGKADPARLRYIFPVNRGVAYAEGRVFVGTLDGRLVAVDAHSGKPLWSTLTIEPTSKRTITGAPRVFGNKVLIGNGGGDYGERGYVTAYDIHSGKQLWRFYTAPGRPEDNAGDPAMEMAAKTWSGQYWLTGTGGTVWNAFTYDPELDRVYVGTGNSGPYNPAKRSPGNGDNLFLVSIVALDAQTGRYIWHYQLNPREAWDYKATADIQIADLDIDGRRRKVLMQAPTNGFFYVIDRETGKLISAEKFGKVTWADRIDLKTGRPVERPNIRYEHGPVTIWPGPWGAHNWQAMAFSPQTGLAYIPAMQIGGRYAADPNSSLGGTLLSPAFDGPRDGKGELLAWDPVRQRPRWTVPIDSMWNGGVLATAGGLVFQGHEDGSLNGYDAATGKSLWRFDAGLGIIAAPISYLVNGRQYVSILVGHGGSSSMGSDFIKGGWKYGAQPRRLLTFAIDGQARLPATAPRDMSLQPLDNPRLVIADQSAERGRGLYLSKNCVICHGIDVVSTGSPGPDLRESPIALDRSSLASLLRGGFLASKGMPKYAELSDQEIDDLFMFIRKRARESHTAAGVLKNSRSGS
ncbi:alcohol dehydrogenase [Sphingomonas sp. Root710]|uniref:PQQ-dependent dehydrogenase, methanol/ethanol family n=1 Tax=Sphingomonas sp. Root710 TaxID=1736594 RepID=UPI0006FEAD90|nr:PQQ-dependent dehydrogenase, methanol/ethanol family [Sphingomonas sp. Root710]KRB86394.1 alcohol dehydrogenase [Sphingomonas sp. Root710]